MDTPDDLKAHVSALIKQGVSPLEVVVVDQHPHYPGELFFEVFEGQPTFYARYRDWVSVYSVLSELFNLPEFVKVLEADGWRVVAAPGTKEVLESYERWAAPVEIEGYDLHGFQQFSLQRANEVPFWFFNWATGAGKSFTCAAGAKWLFEMDQIDLVIACTLPKSKIDMLRFFEHAKLDAVINDGGPEKRKKVYAKGHQVYVMNYEKIRVDVKLLMELCRGERVLFIFDETHKLISGDVDYYGLPKQNKARTCFEKIVKVCSPNSKIWPMSASVVDGNPLRFRDVFSVGQGVNNPLGPRSDFENRYADEIKTFDLKIGVDSRGNDRTYPLTTYDWNLSKLQDIRHRIGDRTQTARKTDPGLIHLFKGIQTLRTPVQASTDEEKIFKAIIDVAWEAYQRGESMGPYYLTLRIAANTPQALLHTEHEFAKEIANDFSTYLSKTAGSTKIDKLNEQLESIRESGDKAVVFTHWTTLGLHLFKDLITVPHVNHWGVGQSDKESQRVKDLFMADPDITCFLTSDAGAHGINFQAARYVIQIDPTYSYDLAMQRASRIDRSDSHLDGLTNFVMITENSVEERVWEVQNARRIISGVVQGTNEVHSYSRDDLARAKQPEAANMPFLMFGDRM